jgi:hypothetical protein
VRKWRSLFCIVSIIDDLDAGWQLLAKAPKTRCGEKSLPHFMIPTAIYSVSDCNYMAIGYCIWGNGQQSVLETGRYHIAENHGLFIRIIEDGTKTSIVPHSNIIGNSKAQLTLPDVLASATQDVLIFFASNNSSKSLLPFHFLHRSSALLLRISDLHVR